MLNYFLGQILATVILVLLGFGLVNKANNEGDGGIGTGLVGVACIATMVISWVVFVVVLVVKELMA